MRLTAKWLPDGMVQTEEGKYSFEDTYAQGGVSKMCIRDRASDESEHCLIL